MTTKTKPKPDQKALARLSRVSIPESSKTPLPPVAESVPAKAAIPTTEAVLSRPVAVNLYPKDEAKIEEVLAYLRAKRCKRINRSRVVQLALRELQLNDATVAAFQTLQDFREKE